MSILDYKQQIPSYPRFNERHVPSDENPWGPPELRPGERSPSYSAYPSAYGRSLAGIKNEESQMDDYYSNELDLLNTSDDTENNGIFSAYGDSNLHRGDGVFQDNANLPGYLAREQFYTASEVEDLTTGKSVNYVPGGAVAFQQGQEKNYYDNIALYNMPNPPSPIRYNQPRLKSIVDAPTAIQPIGTTESDNELSYTSKLLIGAAAGGALGYIIYRVWKG